MHPSYCVAFSGLVLAAFSLCTCFAGPYKLTLKVFSLKCSSFFCKGVCKSKHLGSIIFLALLSKKKRCHGTSYFLKR